ncbi:transposase [Stutzerimonas frequens]|nr:transposase [Stutzerimonas frequens]
MRKTTTYSPEVRERAVRMVLEHLNDYPSEWAAIEAIAQKIGCAAQTLHGWIRRQQTDAGQRPGQPREERERIRPIERENRELRKEKEIVRLASAYFAQAELDRRTKS